MVTRNDDKNTNHINKNNINYDNGVNNDDDDNDDDDVTVGASFDDETRDLLTSCLSLLQFSPSQRNFPDQKNRIHLLRFSIQASVGLIIIIQVQIFF